MGSKRKVKELEKSEENRNQAKGALNKSINELRLFIDSTPDLCFLKDRKGKYLMVNAANARFFGKTEAEILGRTDFELMSREAAQGCMATDTQAMKERKAVIGVESVGGRIYETRKIPVIRHDEIIGVAGIIRDITDQKQAEQALKENEEKYRRIFENSMVGFFRSTPEGRFIDVNPAFARMLRYESPQDLVSSIIDIASQYYANPRDRERYQALLLEQGHVENFEFPARCRDGSEIWVSNSTRSVFDKKGEIIYHEGIVVDITDRKRALDMLQESERRLRQIIEFLPDATFVIDTEGRVTAWNNAMQALTGIRASEILGKSGYLYAVPFYGKPRPVLIDLVITKDKEVSLSYPSFYREENRLFSEVYIPDFMGRGPTWLWATASPLYDPDGQIVGAIESIRDITRHKQVEEALRESQERYRGLVATLPQAVFEADANGSIQYVNDIAFEMFGYDSKDFFPGKYNILEMIAPEDHERVQANTRILFSTGKSPSAEYLALRKDGSKFPVQTYSTRIINDEAPIGIRGIIVDITERKRAEKEQEKLQAQLTQAQKMESMGRLAGGVAHDFNNMLSVIIGQAEIAMMQMGIEKHLYSQLKEIKEAAKRSADLVRQLLAFARKQTIAPKVLNLNDTVEGMLKIIQRLIGENIQLLWQPGENLWKINMDPTQIDQILANLCVNARDAIVGTGKVAIETGNVTLDEDCCGLLLEAVPGDYVLLAVQDEGCGMSEETLNQLFDPFFTTKGVGKGTGLGLPMVYGIVRQNKGFINVYSEPGKGTAFKIYIPRHLGEDEKEHAPDVDRSMTGGNETVLLVEDEQMLLQMGMEMLKKLGYKVLAAGSPSEAVKIAEEHKNDIHLLITDVIMPEMNGKQLADKLLSLYPNLKLLFMSGYTADVISYHGVLSPGVQFIQKPFSTKDIAAKVREVLENHLL